MSDLNCAAFVKLALCIQIRILGLLSTIKQSNLVSLALVHYSGFPLLTVKSYAKQPGKVFGCSAVLSVHSRANVPQIFPSIVERVAIDVVDLVAWPLASHVEPCESMRKITMRPQSDANASFARDGTGNGPVCAPRNATGNPDKNASSWIVLKTFAQLLRGKIGTSHDALLMLIGQRPARVEARVGFVILSVR